MAITSASEFEAVTNHVVIRLEKVLVERGGSAPKLEAARDDMKRIGEVARDGAKLKAQRQRLDRLTDAVRDEISDDRLLDDLWDLLDYIDYRV